MKFSIKYLIKVTIFSAVGHFNTIEFLPNLRVHKNRNKMEREIPIQSTQSTLGKWIAEAEYNRFGLIFLILIIVGCMGGVAVGLGAVQSTLLLSLILLPTMTTLSLLLAVAPMKWILPIASIALLIDSLIIVYLLVS